MTPWTAAYQAPPSMGFSRQEYWSGVPLYTEQVTNEKLLYSTGNSVLWGDLNVREIEKGGNICIRMADSLLCTTETNTIL